MSKKKDNSETKKTEELHNAKKNTDIKTDTSEDSKESSEIKEIKETESDVVVKKTERVAPLPPPPPAPTALPTTSTPPSVTAPVKGGGAEGILPIAEDLPIIGAGKVGTQTPATSTPAVSMAVPAAAATPAATAPGTASTAAATVPASTASATAPTPAAPQIWPSHTPVVPAAAQTPATATPVPVVVPFFKKVSFWVWTLLTIAVVGILLWWLLGGDTKKVPPQKALAPSPTSGATPVAPAAMPTSTRVLPQATPVPSGNTTATQVINNWGTMSGGAFNNNNRVADTAVMKTPNTASPALSWPHNSTAPALMDILGAPCPEDETTVIEMTRKLVVPAHSERNFRYPQGWPKVFFKTQTRPQAAFDVCRSVGDPTKWVSIDEFQEGTGLYIRSMWIVNDSNSPLELVFHLKR